MAKKKMSKQKKMSSRVDFTHSYGGHDDASYHILHAVYYS